MDLFAPWHLVILIGAILLLFGGQKIPELMGGIGKGMKEFKKSIKDENEHKEEPPAEIPKSTSKPERLKD
ncbi:MAG: twin-arginine translocase TatA/TatE family subunit [Mariniphaga sp.]